MQIKKNRRCKKKLKRELKNMVHKQKERGSKKEIYRIQKYDIKDNEKTHNFQKGLQLPKKPVLLFFLSNIYIYICEGKLWKGKKNQNPFKSLLHV